MTKKYITILVEVLKEKLTIITHDWSYREPKASEEMARGTFEYNKVEHINLLDK